MKSVVVCHLLFDERLSFEVIVCRSEDTKGFLSVLGASSQIKSESTGTRGKVD